MQTGAERRIRAKTDEVWSVITDPHKFEGVDPKAHVAEIEGQRGEPEFQYKVSRSGSVVSVVVTDAIPGEQLTLVRMTPDTFMPLGASQLNLKTDGEWVTLHWTAIQVLPWFLRPPMALVWRRALRRWLAKIEEEVQRGRSA